MSLYGEPQPWTEQFPLGVTVSHSLVHLGIRYPGEVIRAEAWSADWGLPLEGEAYFRIVLLQQPPVSDRPAVQDTRIAVCLPAESQSPRRERLSEELHTTRETQAAYLTHRDPQADLIRETLQRRSEELEAQILGEDSVWYSEGEVLTGGYGEAPPHSLFAGLEPTVWVSQVAGWLLGRAYPTLPLNEMPSDWAMDPDAAGEVYRAVLGQPGMKTGIMETFGPGLGLSTTADPATFNPSACPVFAIIRDLLSSAYLSNEAESLQWRDIHQELAHRVGLTGPMATLFLMLYLYRDQPGLVVDLVPGHQVRLVDGRGLSSHCFTPDVIPVFEWDLRWSDWAGAIHSVSDSDWPDWNGALQHLLPFAPGLTPVGPGQGFLDQQQALEEGMAALSQTVATSRETLLALVQEQISEASAPDFGAVLDRLSIVAEATTRGAAGGDAYQAVYRSVRRVYPDFRLLGIDLDQLEQLDALGRVREEIRQAREYLDQAEVPPVEHQSLSLDREALTLALSPAGLTGLRDGSWPALARDISTFKTNYAITYLAHHQATHDATAPYQRELESAGLKLRALSLLNALMELGEPAGLGLEGDLAELDQGPPPCSVPPDNLDVERTPSCAVCGLRLGQSLPLSQLERVAAGIDIALGGKNRYLSALLVKQILEGHLDEQLDDFLKIVQASDLSALSNTLNPELLSFVRGMLA